MTVNLEDLKAGDSVKFRDGKVSLVEGVKPSADNVYDYKVNTARTDSLYTKDGFFYCVGIDHHLDIVEIIKQKEGETTMIDLENLKVGDIVKFRNGSSSKVQKITVRDQDCPLPYSIKYENGRRTTYTRDGFYYSDGDLNDDDIIEIIPQENSDIDVVNISKGDLVTTRDGNTYEVHSIEPNEERDADDSWADYNITLAMYHGGLYTKAGHYQPDCDDPMDIVEVQKVKQKPEEKVIRNHVDLHNSAPKAQGRPCSKTSRQNQSRCASAQLRRDL